MGKKQEGGSICEWVFLWDSQDVTIKVRNYKEGHRLLVPSMVLYTVSITLM